MVGVPADGQCPSRNLWVMQERDGETATDRPCRKGAIEVTHRGLCLSHSPEPCHQARRCGTRPCRLPAGAAPPPQCPGPAARPAAPGPPAALAQRRRSPRWNAPSASRATTTSSGHPRSSPAPTSSAWSALRGWQPPGPQASRVARSCPARSAGGPQPCPLPGPPRCTPAASCRLGCQHTCGGRSPCGWRAPSCAAARRPLRLALRRPALCTWT